MMRSRPPWTRSALLVAAMMLVALGTIIGQRLIASRAFDSLEASTVAGEANRVAVALSYETKLVRGFGATNAIWDDSYDAVVHADEAGFLSAFPPEQVRDIGNANAVVGVDAAGTVLVGGLADGEAYAALPDGLGPDRLRTMVPFDAEAGTGACGLVTASGVPYVFCGFPARTSDSAGSHGFGLVFLRSLDAPTMARLSTTTGMSLHVASTSATGTGGPGQRQATELGTMLATTRVTGSDSLDLEMTLPTLGGGQVTIGSPHARPIHATDTRTATDTFVLMGAALLILLLLVHLLVRRSVHNQVEPLRAATEAIISSGDPDVRVEADGRGEIAALGGTINTLLDCVARQSAEVAQAQQDHEQRLVEGHLLQERTELDAHANARELVNSTVDAVVEELDGVLQQANKVLDAARDIHGHSSATDAITADVLSGTAAANEALAELNGTLQQVHGIVGIIRQITEQTRMLALNANIEAARVGEAGAGFRVVAHEVRNLAADTASSADEIAATTGLVTSTAQRVARSLEDVTTRAAAVGTATENIRTVVADQAATVEQLAGEVRQAVARVRAMALA